MVKFGGMFVDEKTARIRFSADADASNYILVLKEFGGAEIVSTTIVDPTGPINSHLTILKIQEEIFLIIILLIFVIFHQVF